MIKTDEVMSRTWLSLIEDFRKTFGPSLAEEPHRIFLSDGIKGLRNYSWPGAMGVHSYLFKVLYQLENWFKRYRFQTDVYSDAELTEISVEKFMDTQIRCAAPLKVDSIVSRVLREARSICTEVLGTYDADIHAKLCRFGRNAAVGTPKRVSYWDAVLSKPLTGSPSHISWFKKNLKADRLLWSVIRERGVFTYRPTVCLPLIPVPKSWKAKRTIMPDTNIGAFYTHGLGKYLELRLSEGAGLHLSTLADKHARMVQDASITRDLVTADLSSASDSVSLELLRRLLPSKWYRAVVFGRCPYTSYQDRVVRLSSFLTMGLGTTFPLQTLVFYSLVRAMANLKGLKRSIVSVFGDDLIYDTELHPVVEYVFPRLHLILNRDKTYVEAPFRESCGSDYHNGTNVRPTIPEGVCCELGGLEATAWLYKLYNGLTLRWDECEIPSTLTALRGLIILENGKIHQVPPSYPAQAGVHVNKPHEFYPWCPVGTSIQTGAKFFPRLSEKIRLRPVLSERIYMWERLAEGKIEALINRGVGTVECPSAMVDTSFVPPLIKILRDEQGAMTKPKWKVIGPTRLYARRLRKKTKRPIDRHGGPGLYTSNTHTFVVLKAGDTSDYQESNASITTWR